MIKKKCTSDCPPECSFEPNYCTRVCNDAENCANQTYSDCVIYTGTGLQQYGIEPGATVTEVILMLAELLYPQCY